MAGLTTAEVAERIARGAVNDVPARSSRSVAEIVRANVFTRFNAILGTLFLMVLVVGPIQDGLFGLVVVANTAIGILQELRAKRTLDTLALIGEAHPVVRRDGAPTRVATSQIVLDDLLELGPGDKCVVDGTVAEADGLEIDESLLTGEPDPVHKRPGDPVLSGSFVVAGSGAFTATKVGRHAYAARLAEEASRFTLVHSELRSGISRILKYVTWMMVPVAIGLVVSQLYLQRHDWREAVRRMVGGIVPMVPEGLVLLTSVAFAIGVIRLGRRQCLVQELPAIEGLARVDTVCLDKTGTLTEGGMDVTGLIALDGVDRAHAASVLAALGAADPRPNASLRAIVEAFSPPAPATGTPVAPGAPTGAPTGPAGDPPAAAPAGRPVPGAASAQPEPAGPEPAGPEPAGPEPAAPGDPPLPAGAGRSGPARAPDGWRCLAALPFSSARKYSGAVLLAPDGERGTWLLGAPDVLLPAGDPRLAEADALGAKGLRVLLLARTAGDLDSPAAVRQAVPAALVVMEQRLRSDAADTLRYFAEQQVSTKIISGDSAVAVGAVAAKLALPGADRPLDARALPAEREPMGEAVERTAVFGRVTPRQKRDMVGALQQRGHNVAMTGDGVNDVLALKDADIGVAMGSGSEATRAVAQIVLLDDGFSALPWVVAEGRRVIGNITRVSNLFLTKTVYSVLLALLVVIWRVPYPFLPRHSTLLSTLTIGVPAFFLALAPNAERARPRFVRRVMRFALPTGLVAGTATFATYLIARQYYADPAELRAETSAATLTLFLVSLWVLAIIARPYTWWRVCLVAAMGLGFLIVLVTPGLQRFFALKLVGLEVPWSAVGVAVAASAVLECVWRRYSSRTDEAGPIGEGGSGGIRRVLRRHQSEGAQAVGARRPASARRLPFARRRPVEPPRRRTGPGR